MRKIAAILLFLVYAFNLIGYQFVFQLLEKAAEQHLQTTLDRESYTASDLISITVPLSVPYISDSRSFEKADGEVLMNGKIYHYVKRAIQRGSLVLLCLPDRKKMAIEQARQDFSRMANDFQDAKQPKKHSAKDDLLKNITAKYPHTSSSAPLAVPTEERTATGGYPDVNLISTPIERPGQPPETRAC